MTTFTDTELGDIRIALQDRIQKLEDREIGSAAGLRPPAECVSKSIEIERLRGILAKVESR